MHSRSRSPLSACSCWVLGLGFRVQGLGGYGLRASSLTSGMCTRTHVLNLAENFEGRVAAHLGNDAQEDDDVRHYECCHERWRVFQHLAA
jgi:hypothetical protein